MNKSELKIVLQGGSMETSQSRLLPASPSNANHSHIPVPKIPSLVNNRVLHNHQQNNNNHQNQQQQNGFKRVGENVGRSRISVAAQRASFERLQDAVNHSSTKSNKLYNSVGLNNNASNDAPMLRSSLERTEDRLQSSSSAPLSSPVKRNSYENSKLNRSNSSSSDARWKTKYEESERMRKNLLHKSESVNREQADLQRKFRQLQKENETLQSQIEDKDRKLHKLRTVSEAVCKEYEQLKRQYDVETGAMHKAMQQASQWYKQNRELKRRSQVLVQQFLHSRPGDGLPGEVELPDEVDANSDADIEQLRETVTELSQEVARLQTELNAARLQEFEAQEQAALASAQLDEERALRSRDEHKLRELRVHKDNMERVSRMVAEEVQALKTQCDAERERAKIMKIEADRVQKERNVLAHQSALLMAEISDDPNGRLLSVLQEVESLKRLLEEENQDHQLQIQMLQDKLEEKEANVEFEIVEEKLKLAESELEMVVERAERAEKSVKEMEELVRDLEEKISELKNPPVVAPPPPPPPPPPPLPSDNALASIKLATRERMASGEHNTTAVSDMENMLGINPKKTLAVPQQPAIDDIINQIKGGRFTLKQTDKQREDEKKRRQEAESASPAVSEMLNILGTMRRRAKPIRQSFKFADVST